MYPTTYPTEQQIKADPAKAVRWARDSRRHWEEEGARNASMDSGWSASVDGACKDAIALANLVELIALRELLSRTVPHLDAIKLALQE